MNGGGIKIKNNFHTAKKLYRNYSLYIIQHTLLIIKGIY